MLTSTPSAKVLNSGADKLMMNLDSAIRLLDALTKLLSVLLWPAVVMFGLVRFGSKIANFIENIGEFSLKAPGVDVSARRKQVEAAAALTAAIKEKVASNTSTPDARDVAKIATPQIIQRAERATVLWVDDRPQNNRRERQALEALGVTFVLARSTDEALNELRCRSFDAIISDMSRSGDSAAGYTLLDKLMDGGNPTPFFIYTSSGDPEDITEARRRGAQGCTNRPDDLFKMVLVALGPSTVSAFR